MTYELEPIIVKVGQNPLNLNMEQVEALMEELHATKKRVQKGLDEDPELSEIFSLSEVGMTINNYTYSLETLEFLQINGVNQ
ncbi:hypothetical protein [Acinetobacter sp. A47]|uniref:hypothetical protein n=1 Tax=Acinetobacter sp. A47 TaxID=1561217 RepID=UPI000571C982|nr:hypothetical protein [Acinetobacter sp. A47]